MMKITKTSTLSGSTNTMELDITEEQMFNWKHKGMLIQLAMPNLSPDEREFLISGTTPEDWDKMFPPEEEEE
jgi:hypothetical protein